jgi:hypothetical protein
MTGTPRSERNQSSDKFRHEFASAPDWDGVRLYLNLNGHSLTGAREIGVLFVFIAEIFPSNN